jgi:HlyD family secretion protein
VSSETKLFRKVSLERLSSPEQLDQMMEVTTPKGWIALMTVFVVLVSAVVWGFLGNLPSKVEGQGILIRGGNVLDVVTGFSGRVDAILVQSGDRVEAGQEVARLGQPGLETRIANYTIQLDSLRNHDAMLTQLEDNNREVEQSTLVAQQASMDEAIINLQQQVEFLLSRIENQESLVTAGLITRATLLETRSQYFAVLQELASVRSGKLELEVQQLGTERLLRQERNGRRLQIEQTRLELEEMQAQLERSSRILSPHDGRVLQIMVDVGGVAHEGQSFLTMEQDERPLSLVAFVPPEEGKKILVGMEVNLTPTTVKAEEYGHMLGKVIRVSSFPSTPQGMMRILRNESLVQQMSAMGSPIEVLIEPILDPATPSGFRWSSREGPDQQIMAGTMAYASVVVEQRKPITMVLPLLRKWFLGVENPGKK